MTYVVETRSLTKRYGKQTAVANLDLQIPAGSIYGLLGPNGAGKTTALKLVTGLLRPTEGEVHLFGQPWRREALGRVGALIETPALYGNLTGPENLEVHRRMLGLPARRVQEVMEIVGLQGAGQKRAAAYSLGMKQRLGIAIALLSQPELLILDEPTNGLDPLGIQEMRTMIRQFQEAGITVILSSHILHEVAQIVSHVGIIAHGRLLYQNALESHEDLERLFIQVVAEGGAPQ